MTRKRVLNITTRKKRDTMLAVSFPTFDTSAPTEGGYVMNASFNQTVLGWISTARDNETKTGGPLGNVNDPATRTSQECYMVGLKENIEVFTNTGLPWQWRRIIFTVRGFDLLTNPTGGTFPLWRIDSKGFRRCLFSLLSANATAIWANIQTLLFKGQFNTEYTEFIQAPLDHERVDIKYDKLITVSSGNASGKLKQYKMWHKMGHNLIYDDDQVDGEQTVQMLSNRSRRSMGDHYVIDIFKPLPGGSASDTLTFTPNSTLYWHEK